VPGCSKYLTFVIPIVIPIVSHLNHQDGTGTGRGCTTSTRSGSVSRTS